MRIPLLLLGALAVLASGCGDSFEGESCDEGLGDITQSICDKAATDAKCSSHAFVQSDITICSGRAAKKSCCDYKGCSSQPVTPPPTPPTTANCGG